MIDERAAAETSAARKTDGTTRRGLLLAGAAAFACVQAASAARSAAPPARLAAIDWAMLETALALQAPLVGAAELVLFREAAIEPPMPDGVADLGLRGTLSYERLLSLKPDLILISPWYEARAPILTRIAPVASYAIYQSGRSPYEAAVEVTRALGARLGREREAERAISEAEAEIAACRARLAPFAGRPALVINLGDARHFRAFGADSMFGDVAMRLGLGLAWAAPTRFGAYPTVGVEALADLPDAIVANVGPTPPSALEEARTSPLWRAMPPIKAGRFLSLPPVNPYGALPAARRFARLLADAVSTLPHA
ncbi:iron-siderophore ABC transporter substrate-binding protein [Chenggangzhangella methanolivorans]|uniref:Iron-siderophore ABC transporter substrate-binding protein n=1 Tax=Chenggangzhangella methanolivorans TaxID=1437009 RepID=A0A9E6RE95_9HYPH|nr:iron-siderophore ABC transporter substrate-binding protein [Chenggangzhangella methanolivorans]